MNDFKKVLYIVIAILLFIVFCKTVCMIFKKERFDEEVKTEVKTNEITPEEIKVIEKAVEKVDEENPNALTDEQIINASSITVEPSESPINNNFNDVEEDIYYNAQGETIVQKNGDTETIINVTDTGVKSVLDAIVDNSENSKNVIAMSDAATDVKTADAIKNGNFVTIKDEKRTDLAIRPANYDAVSGTMMDGVKMMDSELISPWGAPYMLRYKDNYLLDNGSSDLDGGSMRFTRRSPACCAPTYPPPFKQKIDPAICKNLKNYVPTGYTGSNTWDNAGCACVTKKNLEFLARRGNNA